jgi:hypothetical protein
MEVKSQRRRKPELRGVENAQKRYDQEEEAEARPLL